MTQSASKILDAIRKLILETDNRIYEKQPSPVQQISFESAKSTFSQAEIDFDDAGREAAGMTDAEFGYTNLAFLLSDQCGPVITAAVFKDVTQQSIIGRRVFNGSLFSQIHEAREFLDALNQTTETFEKYERVNRRDYPAEAIEEAILNAVLHRDYATGSGILIKVFSDRMEFISPGGLAGGLVMEDILSGYSLCRNPALMALLARLGLATSAGAGIPGITEAYRSFVTQPKFEATPNVFKLTLPNRNALKGTSAANTALTPEERLREYIQENGSISRKQAEQLLGMSQTATGLVLRGMVDRNELIKEGNSRNIRYFESKY
ncbi:MAG: hypothetical protein FWH28_05355 [Clostridiales bacterium]|nr:hypothetical protein [Clostridiales bacterium]